jgi:hypothetical protein
MALEAIGIVGASGLGAKGLDDSSVAATDAAGGV